MDVYGHSNKTLHYPLCRVRAQACTLHVWPGVFGCFDVLSVFLRVCFRMRFRITKRAGTSQRRSFPRRPDGQAVPQAPYVACSLTQRHSEYNTT